MDLSSAFDFYIGDFDDHMPPWFNFTGRWGPKKTYDFAKEVTKMAEKFPRKVKDKIIKGLLVNYSGRKGLKVPR